MHVAVTFLGVLMIHPLHVSVNLALLEYSVFRGRLGQCINIRNAGLEYKKYVVGAKVSRGIMPNQIQ